MKSGTAKVQCSCEHQFQDQQYGKNVRIANTTSKQPSQDKIEVRCTVCSRLHTVPVTKVS